MADRAEPEDLQGRAANPTETAEQARVFISYASQDAAVARELCQALEAAAFPCWIAPRDVRAGESYAAAIVQAINSCRMLVLVLSRSAIESSHVLREVERASSKNRPVLSIRMDAAPLPPDLEYFLSANHWLDASSGPVEQILPALIASVRDHASGKSSREALGASTAGARLESGPVPAQSQSRSTWWLRAILVALAAITGVGLALILTNKLLLSKHSADEQPTTASTKLISDKSIAVLPFTDMSEKQDQAYFGDGMAEEILDLLAKIPGLAVIGRTSSFQFKSKDVDLRAIGTQLNAAHVLEGSIRKSDERIRITAQLINTRTGTLEWSEIYDRPIGDVLKLQDVIAAAVVRELQLTVDGTYIDSRSILKDEEAYNLVLRARRAADRYDKEGLDEAASLYQQALVRDPSFAEAAAGLASANDYQGEFSFLAPADAYEQARRAAATALKLDSKNAKAHAVLGNIHMFYDWDWAAAEQEYQQARTLAPGSADALRGEAWLFLALGRWDDALRQAKAALARDPMDPNNFDVLAWIQIRRGLLADAEVASRRLLDIRPSYGFGHYYLSQILLARHDPSGALVEIQCEATEAAKQQGLPMVYYALGRKADSDTILAKMIQEHASDNAWGIAEVYAFRGQSAEAMHWLERAYAQKDPTLYLVKASAPLTNLASDGRFKAFLRKMNLPE